MQPTDQTDPTVHQVADEPEATRPLLFERLRRFGLLAALLVPLLVITLAQVRLPLAYAAVLLVGGMALLVAWRSGRIGGGQDER